MEFNVQELYVKIRHLAAKDMDVSHLLFLLPQVISTVQAGVNAPGAQKKEVALELVSLLLREAEVDPSLVSDALQLASVGIDTLIGVATGSVDLGKSARSGCGGIFKQCVGKK